MQNNELVSIVIATYRNIEKVYETIDSIFQQSYPEIEIVISDDGSKNAKENIKLVDQYIVENKTECIKNWTYNLLPENMGTVKNLNSAIKKCKGQFITFISPEDCYTNCDVISDYVSFMKQTKHLLCFGKMRGVTPSGEYRYRLLSCEDDYVMLDNFTPKQLRDYLFKRNCLPAPAAFFSRELFEQYGIHQEYTRLVEDYPYWLYLCRQNVKFGFIDKVMIDYALTGVSSAGSYSTMFMNDVYAIYEHEIFPYDRRFSFFQPIYNMIKKYGLSFYMEKSKMQQYIWIKKVIHYIFYSPLYIYTQLQTRNINKMNEKMR